MSFKQFLKKGTLGDLRERPSPDSDPPASGSAQASDQPATSSRSTRVLYVTGDGRESRIVTGAFSHSHPHLEFDFSVDLASVRPHLSGTSSHDALVVGSSVAAAASPLRRRPGATPRPVRLPTRQSLPASTSRRFPFPLVRRGRDVGVAVLASAPAAAAPRAARAGAGREWPDAERAAWQGVAATHAFPNR